MKSSFKKQPGSKIGLKVELGKDEFQEFWQEAFNKKASQIQIKGFRKGQAPKEIITPLINPEEVFEEAAKEAVRSTLKEISEKNKWVLIDSPKVELKVYPADSGGSKEGLAYEVELVIFPDIKLGNYENIAKKINKEYSAVEKEIKVEEKEVDDSINWLLKSRKAEKLTDEFAQSAGDFKDAKDLREKIREGVLNEKKLREIDKKRARIIKEIAASIKVDMPSIMISKTIEQMEVNAKNFFQGSEKDFEDYIKKNYGTHDKFHESLEKKAEEDIRSQMAISKISEEKKLEPTQKEVEETVNHFLSHSMGGHKKENIDLNQLHNYSYERIRNEKLFKFLESL